MLTILGCGYSLGGPAGSKAAYSGRAVQVEVFDNRTTEADAGLVASRAAGHALAARGGARSGGEPAVLRGVVEQLEFVPAGFGGSQRVTLWRSRARVSLRLEDPLTGEVIARATASGSEEYLSGRDIEATEVARRLAMDRLLRRLADEALDRLVIRDQAPADAADGDLGTHGLPGDAGDAS